MLSYALNSVAIVRSYVVVKLFSLKDAVDIELVFVGFIRPSIFLDVAFFNFFAGKESFTNPFEFDKVGRNLLVMTVEGVVFVAVTLLIQHG